MDMDDNEIARFAPALLGRDRGQANGGSQTVNAETAKAIAAWRGFVR